MQADAGGDPLPFEDASPSLSCRSNQAPPPSPGSSPPHPGDAGGGWWNRRGYEAPPPPPATCAGTTTMPRTRPQVTAAPRANKRAKLLAEDPATAREEEGRSCCSPHPDRGRALPSMAVLLGCGRFSIVDQQRRRLLPLCTAARPAMSSAPCRRLPALRPAQAHNLPYSSTTSAEPGNSTGL